MTKPIHPIQKMQRELCGVRNMPSRVQQVIARHVEPLLDALEGEHTERWQHKHDTHCETCKLIDAWRAKL